MASIHEMDLDLEDPDPDSSHSRSSHERSIQRLDILERRLQIESKRKSLLCCSGTVSKDALEYGVQIGFSAFILMFATYNLVHTDKFHDLSISILMMLTGVYVNPVKKKEKEK